MTILNFLTGSALTPPSFLISLTSTYPVEKITGNFKAKTGKGRAMEKALAVIQFKLEEQTIKDFPEYEMEFRLWLDRLAEMLSSGKTDGLNDTFFPTIDLEDPGRLTPEEEGVINDLVKQFQTNKKVKTAPALSFL